MEVDTSILAASSVLGLDDSGGTGAQREARANRQKNLAALRQTQLRLAEALECIESPVDWVYGRDGALTGLDGDGQWLAGCSLPRRAAAVMVEKLKQRSAVGCMLAPTNAWQIEQALTRLSPQQALIVIVPDMVTLRRAMYCCDFSNDIAEHRLWLAAGEDWPAQVAGILEDSPGLPLPQQFIRLITLAEEVGTDLIQRAQKVFSEVTRLRAARLVELHGRTAKPAGDRPRLCLVTTKRFALWQNAAAALADVAAGESQWECQRLDGDDPRSASNLALAIAASQSAAVVAANVGRADWSGVLPPGVAVVSWITGPRVPAYSPGDPQDQLLLADRRLLDIAVAAGWPEAKLAVAGWPARSAAAAPLDGDQRHLAMIANTKPVDIEAQEFELSSHRLLWEMIEHDLRRNPFAVGDDVMRFLEKRMEQLGTDTQTLDRRRFLDDLIGPLHEQGVALTLANAGVPLRLYGTGWDKLKGLAGLACGVITSPDQLQAAADAATGLVYGGLSRYAHPIDALGRPVLRADMRAAVGLIERARGIIKGVLPAQVPDEMELNGRVLGQCMHRAGVK